MKLRWYLWPLAWVYGFVVYLRNCFFDWGWKKSQSFKTAVISVGNITVGGTGKTPHVEYLIRTLQSQFKVAVVSRGYKRSTKGLQVAHAQSNAAQLGDEPYQIYQKFPQTQVVVEAKRCKAIQYIEKHHAETDVVLLDDAFQHRYVMPGMSILLIDYNRLITQDKILPVGNLREPASARYRASVIVVTKCPPQIKPIELRNLYNEIAPRPYQRVFYTYYQYAQLRPLYGNPAATMPVAAEALLVTGIAQPKPMLDYLSTEFARVTAMHFADHHRFTKGDWQRIEQRFAAIENAAKCLVITEKDAARLDVNLIPEGIRSAIWVLPIEVCFLQNKTEEFNQLVIDYVSKNKRNSRFFGF
jgi:tetraacyldisaccharide 4'-kinase